MSFSRYDETQSFPGELVRGTGRTAYAVYDCGPLAAEVPRTCPLPSGEEVGCPTRGEVSFAIELPIAAEAAVINATLGPLGFQTMDYYSVALWWVGAATAGCWSGCSGFHPCNGSGDPVFPLIDPCVMDGAMIDAGTWVDEATGATVLATTALYAENFTGNGLSNDPATSFLWWPVLNPGDNTSIRRFGLLRNPAPPVAVPDAGGNEYGNVLFTLEQLPTAVAISEHILGYNPAPRATQVDFRAQVTVHGFYVPEGEPPPPSQIIVDVL